MTTTQGNESKTGQPGTANANEIKASFEIGQGGEKQTYLIRKDRVVFGSVESADIKIRGSKVAPIHAVMEIKWGSMEAHCEARLLDLASPTGVFVNGTKVINHVVRSGDEIQIGDAKFKFSFLKPTPKSALPDKALILIDGHDIKTIFDYRPPVKEALEVVYSWNNTILDVKHFVETLGKPVTDIRLGGTKKEDFLIPPVLSQGSAHTLASKTGGNRWTVFLDPKMNGVLYLSGEIYSIADYRKQKLGGEGRGAVTLGENDFVKIEAGTIQFYLSQTVAPPVLRKQTTVIADPFLAKSLMGSLLLTILALIVVSQIDTQQPELVQVPETIATILYHPEKYSVKRPIDVSHEKQPPVEETKPKKAVVDFTKPEEKTGKHAQIKSPQPGKKQTAQSKSQEGAGAKAAGNQGSRGNRNAQAANSHQSAANRQSPRAGQGRGGTQSQVPDNGNIQMLKGQTNQILDLLGGSGQKLGKEGSKLSGFGGFSTQGNGGQALSGSGKGGGGDAQTLIGGTGDHGRGGGAVGTGLGAEGTGQGIIGGKTRVELNEGGGNETVVVGAIDRDAIDAAIRAHRDEFRYCYEREVNAGQPNISGKIVSAFVIGGSGRASQLAVASSSMGSPNVERCVLGVITRIQFPLPAGGVPVTIKYPFAFSNSSK